MLDPEGRVVDGQKEPSQLEGVEDLMLGVCAMTGGRLPVTNSFRLFQVRHDECCVSNIISGRLNRL